MPFAIKTMGRFLAATGAAVALGLFACVPTASAQADQGLSEGVVATVNDDIISSYDLIQRMRFLVVTSGIQVTNENYAQIQQEAMRQLVDERLQIQELRRVEKEQKFEIVATDEDVDSEIADIARSNNSSGDLLMSQLRSNGVDPQTFRDQIRAEVSWQRWIRGRYGSRLRASEDQIRAYQTRLAISASRTQFQIGEIFIDANRAGGAAPALATAQQLVGELQRGAPFSQVARQFSAAPTAAAGGDAGWIALGEMPPEVDAALNELRPGQLSLPIPVRDGVYIVFVRDRRAGSSATLVSLKQAAVALAPDATAEQVEAARVQLEALRPQVTGCDNLASVAEARGVTAGDLGEAELEGLAPAFKEAAATLPVGQLSQPLRTQGGLHLIMVCGRRQSGAAALSREQVENRLVGQQLSMISRRSLRDLRNSATIDVR